MKGFAIFMLSCLFTPGSLLHAAETQTLHSGSWTKKSAKISGTWKIVETGKVRSIVLDEDFKTKKAPDLKLVLSPSSAADVSSKTALKGGKIIALLKSSKGAQTYAIPDDLDLTSYKTLLIHCEKYAKLWGVADL